MKRLFALTLSFVMAAGLFMTGCDEENDNNGFMYVLLAMAGQSSTTYRGVTPDGNFVELIVNRAQKTIVLSNVTSGETDLGPYTYAALDPETEAGGFTIINSAAIGTGDPLPDNGHILFTEVPGETAVVGVFNSDDSPYFGPAFGMAVDNGPLSQYYSTKYNLIHLIANADGAGIPDAMWGFTAFDSAGSTPLDGQLWGMEYSIRHDSGYALGNGSFGLGTLIKDAATDAWIDWDESHPNDWDYATAMLGNHDRITELVFGMETDLGGGGVAIPQADSGSFNAVNYPGTYATLAYTYDFATSTMDVPDPYRAVIAADAQITIYDFAGTPLFIGTLAPLTAGSIAAIHAMSGIDASSDPGIRTASECRGLFMANNSSVIVVVAFDPDGKYAGFYLVNNNGTEPILDDDFIAFGIAVKDENFVNP